MPARPFAILLSLALTPTLPAANPPQPVLLQSSGAGEGPAWHPELGLLTSGEGHVMRRDMGGKVTVYLEGAGTNGLMLDRQGRLVMCQPAYRRVTRIIAHEVDRPNGLVVTPDDRLLYVADNNNDTVGGARKLWRFDLRPDGTVDFDSRKLIHDWKETRGPDGMKLDAEGRLYVAAGLNRPNSPFETQEKPTAGVYVFSTEGELQQFIPIPRDECTNCAFGGDDLKTLFVTAGGTLWSVRVDTPGRPVWPPAAR